MDDAQGYQEGDDHGLVLQKQEWIKYAFVHLAPPVCNNLFSLPGLDSYILLVLWPYRTQDMLKSKLILEDEFAWSLPSVGSGSDDHERCKLKYIGGTDISFLKEDPATACAAVVVLNADTLEVVHEEFNIVQLQVPYIPGFLAFREVLCIFGHAIVFNQIFLFFFLHLSTNKLLSAARSMTCPVASCSLFLPLESRAKGF